MKLTLEEVNSMNTVQLKILIEFIQVCKIFGLHYYMVHGSLLGTVVKEGFLPFDDDIDVAMPRKDYEIFIREGQKYLPNNLFIESYVSEDEYHLTFAKIKDSNTTFFQSATKKLDVNQGIYIDIFPIDYYSENKTKRIRNKLLGRIYQTRISAELVKESIPLWKKTIFQLSKVIIPSWKIALKKKEKLDKYNPKSDRVIITGGKTKEYGIYEKWFGEGIILKFEGYDVVCPCNYQAYLSCIYGDDFMNYDPSSKYLNNDGTVNVSAEIFDINNSYKKYRV